MYHRNIVQTKNELEQYWQKINRENQMRNQRNQMILGKLENLEEHMQSLSSKSNILRKLREQYSEALETLNSVSRTNNSHLVLKEQQSLANHGGYQSFKSSNMPNRLFNECPGARDSKAESKSVSLQTDSEINLCANCKKAIDNVTSINLDSMTTVFGNRDAVKQSLFFALDDIKLDSRGTNIPKSEILSETQKLTAPEAVHYHETSPKNKPNMKQFETIAGDRIVTANRNSPVSPESQLPPKIKQNLFFEDNSFKEGTSLDEPLVYTELLKLNTATSVMEPFFERSTTPSPKKTMDQSNISLLNATTDHEVPSTVAQSTNQTEAIGEYFNPSPKLKKEPENVLGIVENQSPKPAEFNYPKATVTNSVKPQETHSVKPLESHSVKPLESHSVKPLESHSVKPLESHSVKPQETHPVKPQESHSVKPQETHPVKPQETHQVKLQETQPFKPQEAYSNHGKTTISSDSESDDSVQEDIRGHDIPHYRDKEESAKNSPIPNKGVNAYQALLLGLQPSNVGNDKDDSSSEEDFEAHFASSVVKKSEPKLKSEEGPTTAIESSKREEIKKPLTADERRRIQKKMLNLGQDSDSDDEAFDLTKKTKPSQQEDDDDFAFYA